MPVLSLTRKSHELPKFQPELEAFAKFSIKSGFCLLGSAVEPKKPFDATPLNVTSALDKAAFAVPTTIVSIAQATPALSVAVRRVACFFRGRYVRRKSFIQFCHFNFPPEILLLINEILFIY